MTTTESIEQPIANPESPVEGDRRERSQPASSAWPPIAWITLGIVLGVGSSVCVLVPRMSHRKEVVAMAPIFPLGTVNTTAPRSFDKWLASEPPAPKTASGSAPEPKPGHGVVGKESSAAQIFSPSTFAIPKAPPILPLQPPPLKGVIFQGRLPLPPMVSLVPAATKPAEPAASTKEGKAMAARITATKNSEAAMLEGLVAKGVPAAPPALNAPAVVPSSPHTGGVKLVSVNDLATDRPGSVQTVTAYVQKAGGSARAISQTSEGKTIVSGMLIALPESALNDFLKFLSGAGQVRDLETWTGAPDRRRAKLAEDANAQLASLQKLREALAATYLPDSDPVKDTDADIAHAADYVKELQAPDGSDGMALVRIMFVVY